MVPLFAEKNSFGLARLSSFGFDLMMDGLTKGSPLETLLSVLLGPGSEQRLVPVREVQSRAGQLQLEADPLGQRRRHDRQPVGPVFPGAGRADPRNQGSGARRPLHLGQGGLRQNF